jgi:hypothetical protein
MNWHRHFIFGGAFRDRPLGRIIGGTPTFRRFCNCSSIQNLMAKVLRICRHLCRFWAPSLSAEDNAKAQRLAKEWLTSHTQ